jgi:hypothetical protein
MKAKLGICRGFIYFFQGMYVRYVCMCEKDNACLAVLDITLVLRERVCVCVDLGSKKKETLTKVPYLNTT